MHQPQSTYTYLLNQQIKGYTVFLLTGSSENGKSNAGLIYHHPFASVENESGSAMIMCKICGVLPKAAAIPWVS